MSSALRLGDELEAANFVAAYYALSGKEAIQANAGERRHNIGLVAE
jgi:hypothetical protein